MLLSDSQTWHIQIHFHGGYKPVLVTWKQNTYSSVGEVGLHFLKHPAEINLAFYLPEGVHLPWCWLCGITIRKIVSYPEVVFISEYQDKGYLCEPWQSTREVHTAWAEGEAFGPCWALFWPHHLEKFTICWEDKENTYLGPGELERCQTLDWFWRWPHRSQSQRRRWEGKQQTKCFQHFLLPSHRVNSKLVSRILISWSY